MQSCRFYVTSAIYKKDQQDGEIRLDLTVYSKILTCLVQIKYEGCVTARRMECVESGDERLLKLSLKQYPAISFGNPGEEVLLHMHEGLFEKCGALPEYDLFCPELIDLDKFDELQWMETPKAAGR